MLLEIVVIHSSAETIRTLDPMIILYKVLLEGCRGELFVAPLRACVQVMFLKVLNRF